MIRRTGRSGQLLLRQRRSKPERGRCGSALHERAARDQVAVRHREVLPVERHEPSGWRMAKPALPSIGRATKMGHASNPVRENLERLIWSAPAPTAANCSTSTAMCCMSCMRRTPSRSCEKQQRPVRRPDLTFSAMDHTVATKPGRDDDTNPSGAAFLKAMREGSRRNNIHVFDLHDPDQGISHVVGPELGMVLPGATHAVPDSHASTVGGVGALAFGCGTTELAHILATQVMAMKRPKQHDRSARRQAQPSCHRQGRGAEDHRADRRLRRARACRRIRRLGDRRDADRAAHDACAISTSRWAAARDLSRPTRRRSSGSPAGLTRRRARCGTARSSIGGR